MLLFGTIGTDDVKVVDYWNNIDKQLELEMDVLDDLHQDASQVHTHNGWLSYGDELHRLVSQYSCLDLDIIDMAMMISLANVTSISCFSVSIFNTHILYLPSPSTTMINID
jgi:hypothetical protein